jgi:hypothetical protein
MPKDRAARPNKGGGQGPRVNRPARARFSSWRPPSAANAGRRPRRDREQEMKDATDPDKMTKKQRDNP